MGHSGSILVVKKGFVPPKDLVKELLTGVNAAGLVWALNGKLSISRWPEKGGGILTLDQAMEGFETFKTKSIPSMFYFGRYPDGFLADDIQPFELSSKDKRPTLVACLDGEFAEAAQLNSKHSNAFFHVQTTIRPNIDMLSGLVGGDISKIMELAKTPVQVKNFLEKGKRGVVCFLSNTGEVIPLEMANGGFGLEADWGYCSNVYNYGKSFPEKVEEEEEVIDLPWKTDGDSEVEEEEEVVETKPAAPVAPDPDKEKDRIVALMAMYELDPKKSKVRPSAELKSRADLTRWYRKNFGGWCPNGSEHRPWEDTVRLDRDSPVFKELLSKEADKKLSVRFPPLKSMTDLPKDILSAPTAEHKPSKAEQKTGEKRETKDQPIKVEDVPIISGAAKGIIHKQLLTKEFRDRTAQSVPDPKKIQENEKRFGTFTAQLGLKGLEDTFGWGFSDWCDLGTLDMKALATAITQYQNALISTLAEKTGVEEDELIAAFGRKAG